MLNLNIGRKKVKIVATLGPASADKSVIKNIIKNGADVLRLNFSHGNEDLFAEVINNIRSISGAVGILIDLPGPKIRTGKLTKNSVAIARGSKIVLTDRNVVSDAKRIFINYPYLGKDIKPGSLVYIDDGKIKLRVIKKLNKNELEAEVLTNGILDPEKGINFPGSVLSIPSVTDNDKRFLKFGAEHNVDMFAVSFVRSPDDISSVKNFLKDGYPKKKFLIIAKIEKIEAVKNIEKIAMVADALMVARGDLGVEAPVENIPIEQKRIISVANFYKKPVITATQMLLSMVENESPTRAEVTDISNAIFDGTDSVMLSEETAVGKYPASAVKYMSKIIKATEKSAIFNKIYKSGYNGKYLSGYHNLDTFKTQTPDISNIIAEMSVAASKLLKNSIIAAITRSGYTANLISSLKPHVPIIAIVPNESVKRKLSLSFGVSCIVMENIEDKDIDLKDVIDLINGGLKNAGRKSPDYAILTGSVPIGEPGSTDFVKIVRLKDNK
jgi:pyruvate kinase